MFLVVNVCCTPRAFKDNSATISWSFASRMSTAEHQGRNSGYFDTSLTMANMDSAEYGNKADRLTRVAIRGSAEDNANKDDQHGHRCNYFAHDLPQNRKQSVVNTQLSPNYRLRQSPTGKQGNEHTAKRQHYVL